MFCGLVFAACNLKRRSVTLKHMQRRRMLRGSLKGFFVPVCAFALLATYIMMQTRAATPVLTAELESGALGQCASASADAGASGGGVVRFGSTDSCAGAQLPVVYSMQDLAGTKRFVATDGNDVTGTGAEGSPYATLAKAITVAASGDSIIIRGGTYRQGGISQPVAKSLTIVAYPGETPIFNGAQQVSGGWTAAGGLAYISYTPQPATDGSGISFTTGQNLSGDGVGKYPDQVWIGQQQLKEVSSQVSVVNGTFWVDRVANRLYLTGADAVKPNIEVSQYDNFLDINAPDSTLKGLQVVRYSNSADDYGVIDVRATADRALLDNIQVTDSAFQMIALQGSSDILNDVVVRHVTLTASNWMGLTVLFTDRLTVDGAKITGMNQFSEFLVSPQSGGIKTSRTWYTVVKNSVVRDNKSKGVWFDQSNYDAVVANNHIAYNALDASDVSSSNLFYEISDKILIINNYFEQSGSTPNVITAGSSGVSLINNTIVGGAAPLVIASDNRSLPGCADPEQPLCANSYNSDRDSVRQHLTTMDWMPRLDYMVNNIVAYPTGYSYCGHIDAVCIKQVSGAVSITLESMIHQADGARGIPRTYMNRNVYANGTGRLYTMQSVGQYYDLGSVTTVLAASPVSIPGMEANGIAGNSMVASDGKPTASLAALHNQAEPTPTDALINQYLPAGSRHFGATYH